MVLAKSEAHSSFSELVMQQRKGYAALTEVVMHRSAEDSYFSEVAMREVELLWGGDSPKCRTFLPF